MTTTKAPQWQEASDAVRQAQRILIVTHVSPDGDAIGSALGLGNALRHMGKDVTVADDDGVPDYLAWLPNADQIVTALDRGTWDLMISTDASDEVRTGAVGAYGRANSQRVINLDHHTTNTYFGDMHLVLPNAVSATEIVYSWWIYLGITWNRDVAVPLLTGLVTDTLGFRTSSVSAQTLSIAQALMEVGASLTEVTARVLDTRSYQEILLWKRIFPSIELEGQVARAIVRIEDVRAVSADESVGEGLSGFLNQINEAMVSVVFKEKSEREVKISLRAKLGYDVSKVAFALGGGGHKQAAGATLHLSLAEAQAQVLPLLHEAVQQGALQIV